MRSVPLLKKYKLYKFTNHFVTELFEWACKNPKTANDKKNLIKTISSSRLLSIAKKYPRVRAEMSNLSNIDRIDHISSAYLYYQKNYQEIMRGQKKNIFIHEKYTKILHKAFSYFYEDLIDNEFFWKIYNPGNDFLTKSQFRASIQSTIKICSYCDISLITETDTNLDHFLPISKFPFLGIYWANLIVACVNCNGNLNKSNRYRLPVLHSYFDEIHESVKFNFDHDKQTVRLQAKNKHATVVRSGFRGRNYIWLLKLDTRLEDTWHTVEQTRENLYMALKGIYNKNPYYKEYADLINWFAANKIMPYYGQTSFSKLNLDYCEDRKINGFQDYKDWFTSEKNASNAFFASLKK
ncbi:hypothetical protein BK120_23060 [Paenibacillus sp. FSL A5-0031]|uniref:HNH endonuclease n=1 Tax=Paenibacillus sp. FSL A5-0031 TaxID=1920420 RepID=UPI00096DA254|nr:hypothetical protein [Paenibacillus sp. FSL A5-0031]OME78621.1 hypothetical protein BK120_23060 [Paenibacillus sp. FSL A5-0031]